MRSIPARCFLFSKSKIFYDLILISQLPTVAKILTYRREGRLSPHAQTVSTSLMFKRANSIKRHEQKT